MIAEIWSEMLLEEKKYIISLLSRNLLNAFLLLFYKLEVIVSTGAQKGF